MKKILFTLFLLLVAGAAFAQETYSVPATAPQVSRVDRGRTKSNLQTCARFSLAPTCTQAQACTAAGAAGGASCTAAQARAANAEIFAATLAGREAFVQALIRKDIGDLTNQVAADDFLAYCIWWRATGTQVQKDADCTKAGLPAGCDICQ